MTGGRLPVAIRRRPSQEIKRTIPAPQSASLTTSLSASRKKSKRRRKKARRKA